MLIKTNGRSEILSLHDLEFCRSVYSANDPTVTVTPLTGKCQTIRALCLLMMILSVYMFKSTNESPGLAEECALFHIFQHVPSF